MTISDVIIIYLACGTPFGVHYFLKNRKNIKLPWLKALLVTVLWIPFPVIQLHTFITNRFSIENRKIGYPYLKIGRPEIDIMKKRFEAYLPLDHSPTALFQFREVIESYTGLTQALNEIKDNGDTVVESELFNIGGHKNPGLASVCLARRNQTRLVAHQNDSREDFLCELRAIYFLDQNRSELLRHSLEFVERLEDQEALIFINGIGTKEPQIKQVGTVNKEEHELWDSEKMKPSIPVTGSQNLKTLTVAAHSMKKG